MKSFALIDRISERKVRSVDTNRPKGRLPPPPSGFEWVEMHIPGGDSAREYSYSKESGFVKDKKNRKILRPGRHYRRE